MRGDGDGDSQRGMEISCQSSTRYHEIEGPFGGMGEGSLSRSAGEKVGRVGMDPKE